jgi:hypothetical protein
LKLTMPSSPSPLLPEREKGSQIYSSKSLSPALGEGFRVREKP